MHLERKTALVTGGTRGIGREVTRQLVANGARAVVVGRSEAGLDAVVGEHGDRVTAIAVDLSDANAVDSLLDRLRLDHPDIAILINNAAIQSEMDILSPCGRDWVAEASAEIAVNLRAAIALSIGLVPQFQRHPQAAIVNVGSALAIAPKQAAPVYCATKAALRNFTKALRYQCQENAPHILVCDVVMALVDTDMTRGRGRGKITPQQAAASILEGLRHDRSEIWVAKAKVLRIVARIWPPLAERILR